jgi:hypothetical protein
MEIPEQKRWIEYAPGRTVFLCGQRIAFIRRRQYGWRGRGGSRRINLVGLNRRYGGETVGDCKATTLGVKTKRIESEEAGAAGRAATA